MALPQQLGNWFIIGIAGILLVLIAIVVWARMPLTPTEDESDAIVDFVHDFGDRLNNVSLLAPDAKAVIAREYSPYVSAELLNAWGANPENAPGRLTANPHPEGIRVASVQKTGPDSYLVTGYIQEVSDTDPDDLKPIERQVLLALQRDTTTWKIVEFNFTGVRPARNN